MSTLLTSVILTVALLTPSLAKESPKSQINADRTQTNADILLRESASNQRDSTALAAPRTAFLTIEEYAEHAAMEAGIDSGKFLRLIHCESRWQEDAAGDQGTSLGLLQFKKPTFAHFLKKYPIAGADMTDPRHQIDLAARMIADGHLHHWKNCSRKIGWHTNPL